MNGTMHVNIPKYAESLPILLRPSAELDCTRAAAARAVAELVLHMKVTNFPGYIQVISTAFGVILFLC
jgi:hypothetical protein